MKDWYTIPREYGGRTFPLWKRMMLEWLWRRHGQAGLDWYMARVRARVIASIKALDRAFRKSAIEATWTGIQFDRLTKAMREAHIRERCQ